MSQFFDEIESKEICGAAVYLLIDRVGGRQIPFSPDHFAPIPDNGEWTVQAVPKSGAPFRRRLTFETARLAEEWIKHLMQAHRDFERSVAFGWRG